MDTRKLMADAKFYESYSRYKSETGHYETWDESVSRVMGMHKTRYKDDLNPELMEMMDDVELAYRNKLFLGSQRALQFGGEQLLRNNNKLYNCTSTYIDRPEVFAEVAFMMLCGCGVGFSVQDRHTKSLPDIVTRGSEVVKFTVDDSIEGWADAVGAMINTFMVNGDKPEFSGKMLEFDYSNIRPKGSLISGGFKAPGSEPLKIALEKIEFLLMQEAKKTNRMRSIVVYDVIMYIADAVIAGGVRRAATICLFNKEDKEMLSAKTGDWWTTHPERARSNNSCLLLRNDTTQQEFDEIVKLVKDYGEPGFIWTDDLDILFNPCVEISFYGYSPSGKSGWAVCNLTEINGGASKSKEIFLEQCKVATIMGTLQAGYTDFKYVSGATKDIVEAEYLLGVSITGWMNNPDVLFDKETLAEGVAVCKKYNERVAKLIGIKPSARITTVNILAA